AARNVMPDNVSRPTAITVSRTSNESVTTSAKPRRTRRREGSGFMGVLGLGFPSQSPTGVHPPVRQAMGYTFDEKLMVHIRPTGKVTCQFLLFKIPLGLRKAPPGIPQLARGQEKAGAGKGPAPAECFEITTRGSWLWSGLKPWRDVRIHSDFRLLELLVHKRDDDLVAALRGLPAR